MLEGISRGLLKKYFWLPSARAPTAWWLTPQGVEKRNSWSDVEQRSAFFCVCQSCWVQGYRAPKRVARAALLLSMYKDSIPPRWFILSWQTSSELRLGMKNTLHLTSFQLVKAGHRAIFRLVNDSLPFLYLLGVGFWLFTLPLCPTPFQNTGKYILGVWGATGALTLCWWHEICTWKRWNLASLCYAIHAMKSKWVNKGLFLLLVTSVKTKTNFTGAIASSMRPLVISGKLQGRVRVCVYIYMR